MRQERTASGVSENGAEDSQTRLGQHRFGCLVGAMAESHVRQLMCHHSRELCLIVRGFDRAAVHKHKSAGQGKGVDGFVIHAMKFERVLYPTRGQLLRQTHANLCQVSIDLRCVAKRQLLFSIGGGSFAEVYVLLRGELVPARPELCPLR